MLIKEIPICLQDKAVAEFQGEDMEVMSLPYPGGNLCFKVSKITFGIARTPIYIGTRRLLDGETELRVWLDKMPETIYPRFQIISKMRRARPEEYPAGVTTEVAIHFVRDVFVEGMGLWAIGDPFCLFATWLCQQAAEMAAQCEPESHYVRPWGTTERLRETDVRLPARI